jgi:eukaryotic-like serine/threonine-protein kinase
MKPERYKRIDQVFQQALSQPPERLDAFLREACSGDDDLCREVQSLINHDREAKGFIDSVCPQIDNYTNLSGRTLLHYRIIEKIGEGGMGEVFSAQDTSLDRMVALKFLPELFAGEPERLARFEREARLLASLNHPNIATIHGLEQAEGRRFLAMELVEGETLAYQILRGPLPIDEALQISRQIAEGLEAAHEKGIVHRDLKPANVKITPGRKVKILDFGLAKAVQAEIVSPLTDPVTHDGIILGTAAYMSPEQAKGKPVDKRADIWAFGCILCECLTGRPAFRGETVTDILAAVLERDPDLAALPARTPANIRRLLERCLRKEPNSRLRDIGDARLEILDALAATPQPAVIARAQRGTVWAPWTAVAALAVLAGFALWKLESAPATPEPVVRRLVVTIPPAQAFVDVVGNSVLITPDGRAIVYSGRGPQGSQLYYRRLDQLEGTPLPGTDRAACLALSPSGDWVAFESEGDSMVRKVSLRGGTPIALASVRYVGGISWGPDDAIYSAEDDAGLFRIPASGGPPKRIAVPDTARDQVAWFMPLALPDGKHVLVYSYMRPKMGPNMVLVRIADGQVTKLEGEAENPIALLGDYLFFGRPDGTFGVTPFDPQRTRSVESVIPVMDRPFRRNSGMEASLSSAGDLLYVKTANRSQIVFLDGRGRILRANPNEYMARLFRISPDGTQIAFANEETSAHSELWCMNIASGLRQSLATGMNAAVPEWTPDGRRVVFRMQPDSGPAEAWWVPADRSGPPERFLAMPIPIIRTIFSPDYHYVVVQADSPITKSDLYLLDLRGDRKPQPLEQSDFREASPAISPDGRWLAYASDESGRWEVYVRPFPMNGAHVKVSMDGGYGARWEKDSRHIVYVALDRCIRARLEVGAGVAVAQHELLFDLPSYSSGGPSFDLAPDGTIVTERSGAADAEIIVATSWLTELKASIRRP